MHVEVHRPVDHLTHTGPKHVQKRQRRSFARLHLHPKESIAKHFQLYSKNMLRSFSGALLLLHVSIVVDIKILDIHQDLVCVFEKRYGLLNIAD